MSTLHLVSINAQGTAPSRPSRVDKLEHFHTAIAKVARAQGGDTKLLRPNICIRIHIIPNHNCINVILDVIINRHDSHHHVNNIDHIGKFKESNLTLEARYGRAALRKDAIAIFGQR